MDLNIDLPYIYKKLLFNIENKKLDYFSEQILTFLNNDKLNIDSNIIIKNYLCYLLENQLILNCRILIIDFNTDNNYESDEFDDEDIKSLFNVKFNFLVNKEDINFINKNHIEFITNRNFINNLDNNIKIFYELLYSDKYSKLSFYIIYEPNKNNIITYLNDYLELWKTGKLDINNISGFKYNYIRPEKQISNFSEILKSYIDNYGNKFNYNINDDNERTVILFFEYSCYIKINYNYDLNIFNNFEIEVLQKFYDDFNYNYSYNLSNSIRVYINKGIVSIYDNDKQYKLERNTNAEILLEYILKEEKNIGKQFNEIEGIEKFFKENKKLSKSDSQISKQMENTFFSIFRDKSKYNFLKEFQDGTKIIKK